MKTVVRAALVLALAIGVPAGIGTVGTAVGLAPAAYANTCGDDGPAHQICAGCGGLVPARLDGRAVQHEHWLNGGTCPGSGLRMGDDVTESR